MNKVDAAGTNPNAVYNTNMGGDARGGVGGGGMTIGSGETQVAMAGLGTSAGDRAAFGDLIAPLAGGNAGDETKTNLSGEDGGGAGAGAGAGSSEEGGWRATLLWVVLASALVVVVIMHLIFKETSSHKARDRLKRRMMGADAGEAGTSVGS